MIIPIAAVAIWALVLFGSYRYAERIFLIFSLAFLAYPIAAVLGHPDWAQVGSNLVIPHFLYTKSFLLLGVALIGTTYERPATIGLLGDVGGHRVLEAGCGAGQLTAWLADHGAAVIAFDVSPALAELARRAVAGRAEVLVADLAQPLTFAQDRSFDLIVASLVMHYVRDWHAVLGEFRRVLKPDGAVVFSTHHPAMDWQLHTPEDYFAVEQVTETWTKGSAQFQVSFWRRPLTAMAEAIASAGFVIERLAEPRRWPSWLTVTLPPIRRSARSRGFCSSAWCLL